MKIKQLLIFFILFFSKALYAQDSLIGSSKQTIDSAMNINQSELTNSSMATDTKLPVITYKNTDGSMSLIYYDKDNICYQCATIYKTTDVDAVKNIINKRFDQQDKKTWVRKDKKVKAELLVLKGIVAVRYLKT